MRHAAPALWAVRDADTTIYLFGAIHELPPGVEWFDGPVKTAFDRSDALVLELVQPPPAETRALLNAYGQPDGDPPLAAQIPPATGQRVTAALTRLGQPPGLLARGEPWFAAVRLSQLAAEAQDFDASRGTETVLTREAARANKPVTGLETARLQFSLLHALSPNAQRVLLDHALDAVPKTRAMLDATVDAWNRGDAETLGRLANADLSGSPELTATLIEARNRRWADWIAARMQQPGTVFVAVGAGHLAGPVGLQAMLGAKGLKVERVE